MSEYDLVGIGNAMVDVLATVDDAFLEEQTLDKGAMTLVDMDRVKEIYAKMPPAQEVSGGSSCSVLAGPPSCLFYFQAWLGGFTTPTPTMRSRIY